jgi:23S rRNA pseudouridine955/2504/2580 synthase
VHLDSIGNPVAGDPVYGTGTSRRGPEGLSRLFLHAWRLELAAPSGDRVIRAEAPLPEDLEAVLEGLAGGQPGAPGGPGRRQRREGVWR